MNQQRENMFQGKKLFSGGGGGLDFFQISGVNWPRSDGEVDQYSFLEGDSTM